MSNTGQGSYHVSVIGGAYRVCPVCGKQWYITDIENWAYRRWMKGKTGGKQVEFCSWTCLRKWEKDHPEKRQHVHTPKTDGRTDEAVLKSGKYKRGENHPRSKLTEEDVIEIRRMYKTGEYTQQKIAEIYDVGLTRIYMIVNGLSWKHVPMED